MRRSIVFATPELEPVVPGGAGVVVADLAGRLVGESDVTVVLSAVGVSDVEGTPFPVVAVPVGEQVDSLEWHLDRSRLVAEAVGSLVAADPSIGYVELTDFMAFGYWALTRRVELGMDRVTLAVRMHGTVDAITAAVGVTDPLLDEIARVERLTLPLADVVVVPSQAIGEWAIDRYGLEGDRVVVSPPPIPEVPATPRGEATADPVIVSYGTLRDIKGVHDLARAMGPVFEAHPRARLRFIGREGWSASARRTMSEAILDVVDPTHHAQVEFTGGLERGEAFRRMADATLVVTPSRFETFCLAAHEARKAGHAVVVPDLPAFREFRAGYGFATFDRTVEGLSNLLLDLVSDRARVDRLAAEPVPSPGDPTAFYRDDPPPSRHPQSQAGMATEVVHAVEGARQRPSVMSRLLQRALRLVPAPVARLAVRVVPQRFKDRFRSVASWRVEAALREQRERGAALEARIASGEFPEVDAPDVSVVVPCFDQGDFVESAVWSVFDQTHDSWEIVLVDDGSTDALTVETLDRLAGWPRVRLVRQQNRGLPGARNAGMAVARGDHLVPLDADDELTPRFLEVMLEALESEPEAAFADCFAELFGDVEAIWATRPFNPYWELLQNSVVGCVMLRKSAWEAVGGYDETMTSGNEDWELWIRLMEAGWRRVRVQEPLFRYRKHGVSMSVRTEGTFEDGLRRIADRHPATYSDSALAERKRAWYPAVTLFGQVLASAAGILEGDTQLVPGEVSPETVDEARGKYLVEAQDEVSAEVVEGLVMDLERNRTSGWVAGSGVVVIRRWMVLDPVSGFETEGFPEWPRLRPGAFPDSAWMVDPEAIPQGIRLDRQRPEESARIPGWVVS